MKLNAVQWAWIVATVMYFAVVTLDIADVLVIPNTFLILSGLLLGLGSRAVGPSMADIKKAHRRG